MRPLDWVVLACWLVFLVSYGLWRGRGSSSVNQFLLAGKTMPWYAMGLSIMATQASAITFVSTTGQGYVDGLRFVQFYFGLPIAMVLISAIAVPIFHRTNVYTAYEYLEHRFDAKTRALVSIIFLIQRGLAAGISLYAPAVVLSVVLGWPDQLTTLLMGGLVILYTTSGGVKAVTWADVQQMMVITGSLVLAFFMALHLMPAQVGLMDALSLAGAAGRLNAVDLRFDLQNRYNLWSGLIGGAFLALSYFGCDQSQVQRYLTGKSIAQSRLSLIFNALAKIPLQFFILLIGAMVFVLFLFVPTPVLFQPVALARIQTRPEFAAIQSRHDAAFAQRRAAAEQLLAGQPEAKANFRAAQQQLDAARQDAARLVEQNDGAKSFSDTNYIFLHYVIHYLPVGVVGLIIGVIFTAAMSSISGEINSLATVSVIDIYRRHFQPGAGDAHTLWVSRVVTVFWGIYAVVFASYARNLGSLIEAVNMVGSLFYGGLLGVFVLAFFFPRVTGTGAFAGVLAGEAAIFAANRYTSIAFLWYNVIGSVVVVLVGWAVSRINGGSGQAGKLVQRA